DQRGTRSPLDLPPLRQEIPMPAERVECEIRGRSIRVDVGEAAGDLPRAPGDIPNRPFGRGLDGVVELLESFPSDRSFKRVGYDRPPHQRLAGVGHPDEGVAPLSGGAIAVTIGSPVLLGCPAMVGAAF